MDTNSVEVTVTATINGVTYTKSATAGSTSSNPYRLAENVISSVAMETKNAMGDAKFGWDQMVRQAGR
jgi:hypothetical protein